ncbi:MAG: CBS domain-containing protein [bacterium]
MRSQNVRDIMLPLGEYVVVTEGTSLFDALLALEVARSRRPPHSPRLWAVLVADKSGHIVGKLGMRAFLAALEPKYETLGDLDQLNQAGLSPDFLESILDNYRFWQDDREDIRRRANTLHVCQAMQPIHISIGPDASLAKAIHLFVMWNTLSLLVVEDDRAVGILRLSDLFQHVSAYVTSGDCRNGENMTRRTD